MKKSFVFTSLVFSLICFSLQAFAGFVNSELGNPHAITEYDYGNLVYHFNSTALLNARPYTLSSDTAKNNNARLYFSVQVNPNTGEYRDIDTGVNINAAHSRVFSYGQDRCLTFNGFDGTKVYLISGYDHKKNEVYLYITEIIRIQDKSGTAKAEDSEVRDGKLNALQAYCKLRLVNDGSAKDKLVDLQKIVPELKHQITLNF